MAKINLVSLRCVRRQDVTGKDEPEILIDGFSKWYGVVGKGETVPLRPVFEDFGGRQSVTLTLRERNGPSNKVIGTRRVTAGHPDPQPVDFKTSGAHYELRYTLT